MYDELVKRLREKAGAFDYDGRPDIACDYEQAADAIEELMAFARFVAEEIVVDDNEWGNNQNAFPEIACRKLFKLGIVSRDGEMWHYEPPKEG